MGRTSSSGSSADHPRRPRHPRRFRFSSDDCDVSRVTVVVHTTPPFASARGLPRFPDDAHRASGSGRTRGARGGVGGVLPFRRRPAPPRRGSRRGRVWRVSPGLRARRPRRGRPPSPRRSLGRLSRRRRPRLRRRDHMDRRRDRPLGRGDGGHRRRSCARRGPTRKRVSRGGRGRASISLGGGWVVPGLHDAHLHLVSGGFRLAQLDLSRVASRDAFERLVADRVARLDDDAWVLGGGWDHTNWGGEEPTAEWFPGDVKAWLLRADAHVGVASRAALRAAGIDANTPDPPGGIVDRDADGNPTGTLRENAIALVSAAITPASEEARHAAFRRAFDHLLSLGVTSVCDFGDVDHLAGSSVEGATERLWRDLEHLESLDAAGRLPSRQRLPAPGGLDARQGPPGEKRKLFPRRWRTRTRGRRTRRARRSTSTLRSLRRRASPSRRRRQALSGREPRALGRR